MREIEFRGNYFGEWVYGSLTIEEPLGLLIHGFGKHSGTAWRVAEKSVGQYTGLKDKNGKKIYEGDNVTINDEEEHFLVEFEDESARFILSGSRLVYDFDNTHGNECEVISNNYDNSELLRR